MKQRMGTYSHYKPERDPEDDGCSVCLCACVYGARVWVNVERVLIPI